MYADSLGQAKEFCLQNLLLYLVKLSSGEFIAYVKVLSKT